jgi:DNA polymerase III subunit delta
VTAEALLPVYLLTGSDWPKIRRALSRLRSRLGDEALEVLNAAEATGADAVAACNAMGLFGVEGGRLVVVEGVERWKADDTEAVAEYLREPTPGSILALVAGGPLKSKALGEACSNAGRVLAFDVPKPRDLPAWVRLQFERLGTPVDVDATRALVELAGEDAALLTAEIEKLSAWAGGEKVTRADVERLAVPSHEAPGWALTDAWGGRDVPALLSACEQELEQGTQPFLIATRLASQVGLVRAVRALADEGLSTKEIAKRVRRHEFRVRKALGHAENYSAEELDAATVRLAALDAALKGASRLAGELELSRALIELTSPREAASAASS